MTEEMTEEMLLARAAHAICSAEALLIGAGAGMSVDSGLPDFRGQEGFWKAYPPYAKLGLKFTEMANPHWFTKDPPFAWGFYGHRQNLYRTTQPHEGFTILRSWAERKPHGAFVFTSNVDGYFQRTGFDAERILEIHGSLDWMQCMDQCGAGLFASPSGDAVIPVDETTMRAVGELPRCPACGGLARPNVLMFDDWQWEARRMMAQQSNLEAWIEKTARSRLVILECGAGTGIPTVRHFCEEVAAASGCPLVRINVREASVPRGQIGLAMGALQALERIDAFMA
jgi:NAD-dependent SIR2 family protein deacetylase